MAEDNSSPDKNFKKRLIDNVKKEVKQIMEEAVTKKFVHEESSSVTSLCAAVEACLSQGLRRRALGLFKTSSTTALLHKVAKNYPPAEVISRKVLEIESVDPIRRSSSSGDSTSKSPHKPPLQKKNSSGAVISSPRYLWIRLALFEKNLARIIDHLVQNSSKYYEKDSLVADPDYGSILSSLLVGPCALDYSRAKTQDHFWTDPPADELVQRHRISSGHGTPPTCRRPALNFRRSLHGVSSEDGTRQTPITAKDYVESLHQNHRATLLYGKNNVLVLPKELAQPMPGYLSLHQTAQSLTIKWTPNQLMNGYAESDSQDKRLGGSRPLLSPVSRTSAGTMTPHESLYWNYAMNVKVEDIVYVHCHQQGDNGGVIVLVGQDGVQRPPIRFPEGGHLLAFLSCLETGLLPRGSLDPPLWPHHGKGDRFKEHAGKVFPSQRRRGRPGANTTTPSEEAEESSDYVFRIVNKSSHEEFLAGQDLLDVRVDMTCPVSVAHGRVRTQLHSTSTSSTSSSKSLSLDPGLSPGITSGSTDLPPDSPAVNGHNAHKLTAGDSIQLVCDTMRRQIISRAFYGWLAYCRHLRTVRTHLSGLVSSLIVCPDVPDDARGGVTPERWSSLTVDGTMPARDEVFRLAYFGGVAHELRKQVWPYLLGYYAFGSTVEERNAQDAATRHSYEATMSEWLAVEAIVRQRDKETMAANLAKLSSESTSGEQPPPTPALNANLSNDVFEDNASLLSDEDEDEPVLEAETCTEAPNSDTSGSPSKSAGGDTKANVVESNGSISGITKSETAEALATAAATAVTVAAAPADAPVNSTPAVIAAAAAAASLANTKEEVEFVCNSSTKNKKPEIEPNEEEAIENGLEGDNLTAEDECPDEASETKGEETIEVPCEKEEKTEDTEGTVEESAEKTGDTPEKTEDVEEKADDVEDSMNDVEEKTEDVEEKTEDVEEKTEDVEEKTEDVEEKTEDVEEKTEDVEEKTEDVEEKTEDVEEKTEDVEGETEDTEDNKKENPGDAYPESSECDEGNDVIGDEISLSSNKTARIVMTKPSVDSNKEPEDTADNPPGGASSGKQLAPEETTAEGSGSGARSNCVSPASSQGGIYSTDLLDKFGLNIHRIDKDVQRCDRNYWYFSGAGCDNLEKLRNVMCTYVWEHLDVGYMQGMCDLVAPLLVILDDEAGTYACFCRLMERMGDNFPNGGAMDTHFANMRSLIQILDSEMFELMHQNGDYTHFYFCYRWFLLDFKRELVYDDVFVTWETIWAAQHVASTHFVLFIALALVQMYRDIILNNSMDFTDIIKFFNEMAERHDAKAVLNLARDLVLQLQTLMENK